MAITLYQINTYDSKGKCVAMSKTNRGKPTALRLFKNAKKRAKKLGGYATLD